MSAHSPNGDPSLAPIVPMAGRTEKPGFAAMMVGMHLRDLRESLGLQIKDVAGIIRASDSKLSRMERGENPQSERDVLDLLKAYRVTDEATVAVIKDLARQARQRTWYRAYNDVMPGWSRRLIGLVDSARAIRTYETSLVPGLLQTQAYARAIVCAGLPNATAQEVERRVELRMRRQEVLRDEAPPNLQVILNEAVLHLRVAEDAVMAEQFRHLRPMTEHPYVTIRVVRFANFVGLVPPPAAVTHLTFPRIEPSELIYLEESEGATYHVTKEGVDPHRRMLDQLIMRAEARGPSLALLDEAAARFADRPPAAAVRPAG